MLCLKLENGPDLITDNKQHNKVSKNVIVNYLIDVFDVCIKEGRYFNRNMLSYLLTDNLEISKQLTQLVYDGGVQGSQLPNCHCSLQPNSEPKPHLRLIAPSYYFYFLITPSVSLRLGLNL